MEYKITDNDLVLIKRYPWNKWKTLYNCMCRSTAESVVKDLPKTNLFKMFFHIHKWEELSTTQSYSGFRFYGYKRCKICFNKKYYSE